MEQANRTYKEVFTVVERANDKSIWVRIGGAFVNRDGSMNLKLDALPVNGTLQVRDPLPREESRGNGRPMRDAGRAAATFDGV